MTSRNIYGGINRTNRSREIDRRTWAEKTLHVFQYDRSLSPTNQNVTIDFLTVFEGQPLLKWAVELRPESPILVASDYPMVAVGVGEWIQTGPEPREGGIALYSGAVVWTHIEAFTAYLFTFRLGFEGVIFKNVSTLRGQP